ncbi:hypothetical protein FRC01_006169 [Tulasnella sp. 417]|nr:hypothetical protein FRC01_006169 [Tulasnella sp. 417]
MLASTFLSAAATLFFLPAVFSAPITPDTSLAVPEVDATTITTTKAATIQKATEILTAKKSELETLYESFVAVDYSTVDAAFLTTVCDHTASIIREATNEIQAISTSSADGDVIEIEIEIGGLVQVICGILVCVIRILGHVVMLVGVIGCKVTEVVGDVVVTVCKLLECVKSLVPTILAIVAPVLVTVEGIVGLLLELVTYDVKGITSFAASMGVVPN